MKATTYGPFTENESGILVGSSSETKEVHTSFTSKNYLQNIVNVHMTADEARYYAHLLIVYANKIDPSGLRRG